MVTQFSTARMPLVVKVCSHSLRGAAALSVNRPEISFDVAACCSCSQLTFNMASQYIVITHMASPSLDRELKKGSAELLILSLIESRARHGYEISKLIEARSGGTLRFHVASLYPLLYRLEGRGWIQGRWVERAGQRRRRYYRLTPQGRKILAAQRQGWQQFVEAIRRITGIEYA